MANTRSTNNPSGSLHSAAMESTNPDEKPSVSELNTKAHDPTLSDLSHAEEKESLESATTLNNAPQRIQVRINPKLTEAKKLVLELLDKIQDASILKDEEKENKLSRGTNGIGFYEAAKFMWVTANESVIKKIKKALNNKKLILLQILSNIDEAYKQTKSSFLENSDPIKIFNEYLPKFKALNPRVNFWNRNIYGCYPFYNSSNYPFSFFYNGLNIYFYYAPDEQGFVLRIDDENSKSIIYQIIPGNVYVRPHLAQVSYLFFQDVDQLYICTAHQERGGIYCYDFNSGELELTYAGHVRGMISVDNRWIIARDIGKSSLLVIDPQKHQNNIVSELKFERESKQILCHSIHSLRQNIFASIVDISKDSFKSYQVKIFRIKNDKINHVTDINPINPSENINFIVSMTNDIIVIGYETLLEIHDIKLGSVKVHPHNNKLYQSLKWVVINKELDQHLIRPLRDIVTSYLSSDALLEAPIISTISAPICRPTADSLTPFESAAADDVVFENGSTVAKSGSSDSEVLSSSSVSSFMTSSNTLTLTELELEKYLAQMRDFVVYELNTTIQLMLINCELHIDYFPLLQNLLNAIDNISSSINKEPTATAIKILSVIDFALKKVNHRGFINVEKYEKFKLKFTGIAERVYSRAEKKEKEWFHRYKGFHDASKFTNREAISAAYDEFQVLLDKNLDILKSKSGISSILQSDFLTEPELTMFDDQLSEGKESAVDSLPAITSPAQERSVLTVELEMVPVISHDVESQPAANLLTTSAQEAKQTISITHLSSSFAPVLQSTADNRPMLTVSGDHAISENKDDPLSAIIKQHDATIAQLDKTYIEQCSLREARHQAEQAKIAAEYDAASADTTLKFTAENAAIDAQRQQYEIQRQQRADQLERDRQARNAAIKAQLAAEKAKNAERLAAQEAERKAAQDARDQETAIQHQKDLEALEAQRVAAAQRMQQHTQRSVLVIPEHKPDNRPTGFTCWGVLTGISAGGLLLMVCAIHPLYAVLILKAFYSATAIKATTSIGLQVGGIGMSAMTFFGGAIDLVRYCNKSNLTHSTTSQALSYTHHSKSS